MAYLQQRNGESLALDSGTQLETTEMLNLKLNPPKNQESYRSSLFCRMQPSMISLTSGKATLSKLPGLTPYSKGNTKYSHHKMLIPKTQIDLDFIDSSSRTTIH